MSPTGVPILILLDPIVKYLTIRMSFPVHSGPYVQCRSVDFLYFSICVYMERRDKKEKIGFQKPFS